MSGPIGSFGYCLNCYHPLDVCSHCEHVDTIRDQRDALLAALKTANEAMNPADLGGISLHVWNQRLKAATIVVRAAIARAEGVSLQDGELNVRD